MPAIAAATQYMIQWKTKDHKQSIERFQKLGHDLPAGLKVVASWHGLANGKGFLVIETSDPKLLHAAAVKWADVIEAEISQVISDADAKQALSAV